MASSQRPLRILHVLPWITSGGVEKRRLLLAKLIPRDAAEHHIFCLETREKLAAELEALGVGITTGGRTWQARDLAATWALRRCIGTYRPDIVHGAVFEGTIQATLASALRRRHKLVLEETGHPLERSVWGSAYAQMLFRRADMCVAVSDSIGHYLRSTLRLPEAQVAVITNGIESFDLLDDAARETTRRSWGFGPEHFVIAGAGRMWEHHKRMEDTIRALGHLRAQVPVARLVLIGDGPDRQKLEGIAAELGLADHVRFLGYQRNVGQLLQCADVLASASNQESFGQVIVEAMLAGIPVVTTTVGGPSEIVVPFKTGLFIPVGNPPVLAESLATLYRDPGLRKSFGQAGQTRARRLYTAERYAEDVLALYQRLAR